MGKKIKNNIIQYIIVFLGLSIIITFIAYYFNASSEVTNSKHINKKGNSQWNIANGGEIARQGKWVYYANPEDNWKLYKMKEDHSAKEKLSDISVGCINVVGDYVYFLNNVAYGNESIMNRSSMDRIKSEYFVPIIYKLNINDGSISEFEIKKEEDFDYLEVKYLTVVNDWIYYSCSIRTTNPGIYKSSICKMKTDGSEERMVFDKFDEGSYLLSISLTNKKIYYRTGFLNESLLDDAISGEVGVVDYSGENNRIISDVVSKRIAFAQSDRSHYMVANGSGCFIDTNAGMKKINVNNGKKVDMNIYENIVIKDNRIFYIDYETNMFNKMSLNGKAKQSVVKLEFLENDNIRYRSIIGNINNKVYIETMNENGEWSFYCVDLRTKEVKKV